MACSIERNSKGKITAVKTPQGENSKLFEAVHSVPYLADSDMSLAITKNGYAERVEKIFQGAESNVYDTGEPQIFFKTDKGNVYDSIEEVIIKGEEGGITMGFVNPKNENFLPVSQFDMSEGKQSQFITSTISQGLLHPERVLMPDGTTRYQGKGNYAETRAVTAQGVRYEFAAENGMEGVKVYGDGTLTLKNTEELTYVVNEDGTTSVARIQDIPELLKDSKPQNMTDLLALYIFDKQSRNFKNKKKGDKSTVNVERLTRNLTKFLESIGFSVTSLESYKNSYNTRYGEDPDIKALSDIANRVVAFADGQVTLESLSEEVAHIAIELYKDQNSIVSALSNVHLTPEYNQFAESYREKYANLKDEEGKAKYKGAELETQVRKEVLGKILKSEFLDRFSKEGKTKERRFLIDRLIEIWDNLVDKLRGRIKNYHRNDLQKISEDIVDSVFEGDLSTFDMDMESSNVFYDTMDTKGKDIERSLKTAKVYLETLFKNVLNEPVPNDSELDRIGDELNEVEIARSVNSMISVSRNQAQLLLKSVEQATKNKEALNATDQNRFKALLDLDHELNLLRSKINGLKSSNPKVRKIVEGYESQIVEFNDTMKVIEPQMDAHKEEIAKKIAKETAEKLGATESQTEEIIKKVEVMQNDQGLLARLFGTMTGSKNPIINLIARKAKDLYVTVTMKTLNDVNPLIREITDKGLMSEQKNVSKGAWYKGATDWAVVEKATTDKTVNLVKELTGREDTDKIRKELESTSVRVILGDAALHRKYKMEMDKWKTENNERAKNEKYYEDKEVRYTKAEVSDSTRDYIEGKNRVLGKRRSERKRKGVDTIKTEQERLQDRIDAQNHKKIKSPISNGEVREGLKVVNVKDLTPTAIERLRKEGKINKNIVIDSEFVGDIVMVDDNYTIDSIPEDARVSLDLFNLDMITREKFKNESNTRNPTEEFVTLLKEIEDRGENAYEWLLDNASVSLSSAFFENMDTGTTSYEDLVNRWVAEEVGDPDKANAIRSKLEELKDFQRQRKSYLKIYRKPNNPIETDAQGLPSSSKQDVVKLDEKIAETRRSIGLPSEYYDDAVTQADISIREVNEDFELLREESGLSVVEFAMKHMTENNKGQVRDFTRAVEGNINGKNVRMKSHHSDFILNALDEGLIREGMSNEEKVQILSEAFAKSKVASYFQRYEPKGYSDVLNALKDGNIKPSELFTNRQGLENNYPGLEFLEIVPEYQWIEDFSNEEYNNPNYTEGGYYLKPKLFDSEGNPTQYLDTQTLSEFGISLKEFRESKHRDLLQMKPTKNQKRFELLKMMVEMNEQSVEGYREAETQNKYLRPQIHRSKMEAFASILNPNRKVNLGERLKDIFQYRVDEKEYGEEVSDEALEKWGGSLSLRVIPKYFLTKLENEADLTDNIIEAQFLMLKESVMFDERSKAEADFNALLHTVGQQRFINGAGGKKISSIGTKGQVSNYYQKADEYVNHVLYGVNQTRKMQVTLYNGRVVNMTKAINLLQSWVRYSNLAYNFLVDLTSFTTGKSVNWSDRMSQQFYHSSSASRGNALSRQVFKYIAEEGKFDKTSEMNHMLELFGVQELDERIKNSAFGRGLRVLGDSGYMMGKISNMGIKPQILMTNLADTRFIEGKWRSYPEYVNFKKNIDKSITKKQIEAEFKAKAKESVYDHLEFSKTGIKPNAKFLENFDNPQKEFEELVQKISAKTESMIQITDTVLSKTDRTAAQRDVLTNTLMMHKGWMPINLTKRFKGNHFNFNTGIQEEGHYSTLFRLIKELTSDKGKTSLKDKIKDLDQYEKANLGRVLYDAAFLATMAMLGMILFKGDDDDDSYLEDVMQYVFLRTSSELNSANIFGMGKSVIDVAKSPITAISTLEILEPVSLLTDIAMITATLDGEKAWKMTKKLTPLKRVDQWSDIQDQMNSYWHFNSRTIPFSHPIRAEKRRLTEERKKQRDLVNEMLKRN